MPYYLNLNISGITSANSNFTGTSITVKWATAYPKVVSNKIAYNIYFNDDPSPDFTRDHFNQSPVFICTDSTNTATIEDLTPGTMYHFAVRALEYNPNVFNFTHLPLVYGNLRMLPKSLLSSSVSAIDTKIHLVDSTDFPVSGQVKIGKELITYSSIDGYGSLVVSSRGDGTSVPANHSINGYDGYYYWDPQVTLWPFEDEENNTRVFECQARFDSNEQKYLPTDGYHQKLLNTDMTISDQINSNFPSYDFNQYHTDPRLVLSGKCIGSYIGGTRGCIDGYTGSFLIRGVSPVLQNLQRQEILLNTDGEPVILVRRQWTGLTCTCYVPEQEYPEGRCNKCFGTGMVVGWQQFFSPRRSDKKIMVRFDPTVETVDPTESGLESNLKPNCWTLTVPTIHERDFIVRFDQAGNEEFRYEVLNVTRNKFVLDNTGLQRFALQRVRKTDPIYMVPIYTNVHTNTDGSTGINIFRKLSTSINMSVGFPPHTHTVDVSDTTISPLQINGITSISQGHSHVIRSGIVTDGSQVPGEKGIGHTHTLIWAPP
jgi:hypothetical protein